MTVFGILLILVGIALLLARGRLIDALRSQSAKGFGPQPSRGSASAVYLLCALAAVVFGVVLVSGVLPHS